MSLRHGKISKPMTKVPTSFASYRQNKCSRNIPENDNEKNAYP